MKPQRYWVRRATGYRQGPDRPWLAERLPHGPLLGGLVGGEHRWIGALAEVRPHKAPVEILQAGVALEGRECQALVLADPWLVSAAVTGRQGSEPEE